MLRPMRKGFTLIELLIVVAIIAILAAIAVPNFLEAQTRAKVSRCRADMRTIATGLESYMTDFTKYPPDAFWYLLNARPLPGLLLCVMTTPVAYLTSLPEVPFYDKSYTPSDPGYRNYRYWAQNTKKVYVGSPSCPLCRDIGKEWVVYSIGPDLTNSWGSWALLGDEQFYSLGGEYYDPTNGTISSGDIIRLGP
jgi:prepilin-type N-terminal cleavage/methylation domain-containing protein